MPDIIRYGVTRRWSDAVLHAGVAYFVEVADDPAQDARGQIRQVLEQVTARLQQVGSDPTRLLQVLIYLPDRADLPTLNALWEAWVPEGHAPSRACLITELADPRYRIELVVTAAVNQ